MVNLEDFNPRCGQCGTFLDEGQECNKCSSKSIIYSQENSNDD